MKKEIISAVTALTTAFSGMTAMMTTAVDETTASAFLTRISAGVYLFPIREMPVSDLFRMMKTATK